jgi:hypothetical protein
MPKITTSDVTALGFSRGMFALEAADYTTMVTDLIAEQAALLEGRIGSTSYASTSTTTAAFVKRAEKCLVAAELLQRRFVILSQEIQAADGMDAFKVRKTRQAYIDEADQLIDRIVNGQASDSTGYSGSVATSSHFSESTTLGGLEVG